MTESNEPQLKRTTVSRPSLPGRVVVAILFFVVAIVVAYAVNRVMYGDDEIPAGRERRRPMTSIVLDSVRNLSTYTLTSADISRLKAAGLTDPAGEILYDLTNHNDLIPAEASLGGTMLFFPTESHFVGPNQVLAYFEDGHTAGRLLLSFEVADGEIHWTVIERLPPPTP
jgi:hypothetical protein